MAKIAKNFAYLACFPKPKPGFWRKLFTPVSNQCDFEKLEMVTSSKGKEAQGYIVHCKPFCPADSSYDEYAVFNQVLSLSKAAVKLGVRMIGLDGYAGILGKKSHILTKKTGIPFTTGSCLIAWSTFEAVFRAAKLQKLDLKKAAVAVFGADEASIALCCRRLVTHVGRLVLCDCPKEKAQALQTKIKSSTGLEVLIAEDPGRAIKEVDIVIVPSEAQSSVNPAALKPASILCVVAGINCGEVVPQAINGGVVVVGGLMKLPAANHLRLCPELPQGVVHASLAETMLLTLEECFGNYSSDENTNLDKLEEIADMATRNGFEVWVPQAPVL